MIYLVILIILFILEILYFKVADRFNIIDKPNERSSHTLVTLRGGGIIFYFAAIIYFIWSGLNYPWFFLGLTLMSTVSFLDDIFTLSNRIRLIIHFTSVLLMAYELNVFEMPWYFLLITFLIVVGVINAYNFMDGINGITACYSLSVGSLLMIVNNDINFVDQNLLSFTMLGVLVFAFFNFRNKAKAFAGDVGSVSIAFILIFALGALIIKTGNFIYILFLLIYGLDSVWTIIRRLYLRENIFEAHRSHLYQYLGNEAGKSKLIISFGYGIIQFIVGILIIFISNLNIMAQIVFSLIIIFVLSVLYICLKGFVLKKFVKPTLAK